VAQVVFPSRFLENRPQPLPMQGNHPLIYSYRILNFFRCQKCVKGAKVKVIYFFFGLHKASAILILHVAANEVQGVSK
jgi:hypothetical protein